MIIGGADVCQIDELGRSLLQKASMNGNARIVQLLVENYADIHHDNQAALITACSWGRLIVVKELIGLKSDVNHVRPISPMNAAAKNGHLKVLKALVDAHADVNTVDGSGNDPWEMGMAYNNTTIRRSVFCLLPPSRRLF